MFQVSFIQLPSNSLKGRSQNVGLPDKFDIQTLDHLPIPPDIQGIPPNTKVLVAYATPDPNRLKLLFNLLF